jgi:hypothetical protein
MKKVLSLAAATLMIASFSAFAGEESECSKKKECSGEKTECTKDA